MKRLFLLLLLALAYGEAQNTSISSSMVDTDGTTWANGTWKIDFRPSPNYPNESTYRLLNGQPLSSAITHQNGALDASGHFSVTIYNSSLIAPIGSGWTLTICPLASAPCGTYQFVSAGATMDISVNLTASIPAPRFPPNNGAFGYADVEVQTTLNQGAMYWNVTTQTNHIWNGVAWVSGGGGTGGGYPGVVTDNNNGLTITGGTSSTTNITSGPPMVDIRHPSFAGGAKCNGVADDGPAIQAAITANTGGGQILIPGLPSACVWNNPTAFVWPAHNALVFNIQGTLKVNSTLPVIGQTAWNCLGGTTPQQFQAGQPCLIQGPTNTGSFTSGFTPTSSPITAVAASSGGNAAYTGTFVGCAANACAGNYYAISGLTQNNNSGSFQAIASTLTTLTLNNPNAVATTQNGSAWLLTPVSVNSTTNLYASTGTGSYATAISVVDTLSCTPTSIQRLGDGISVYAAFSSGCHIPSGANITVSGMTDSTFNGTFIVTGTDYILNYLYWRNSGTANATTSGGTVAGFNEDTAETVSIVNVTGSQIVANFSYAHTSGAAFGIVGIQARSSWWSMKDLKISSSGTGLWVWGAAQAYIDGIGVGLPGSTTATAAIEFNQSFWIHTHHISTVTSGGFGGWTILMTNPLTGSTAAGNVTGFINDDGMSTIMGGIKMSNGASNFSTKDSVIERVAKGAIILDSRNYGSIQSTPNLVVLHNVGLQDNLNHYIMQAVVVSEYGGTARAEGAVTGTVNLAGGTILMNDYYAGKMQAVVAYGNAQYGFAASRGVVGTLDNGMQIEGEVRGIGANGGPQLLPFATTGVPQNPANWGTNCTVSQGIRDPFGGTGAGALTVASGTSSSRIYNYGGLTPHQGDYILYGAIIQAPEFVVDQPSAGVGAFYIDNTASGNFTIDGGQTGSPGNYDMQVIGDWWHSVVGLSSITSSNGTGGQTIRFGLNCQAGITSVVYMPWMMYIPAVVTTASASSTTASITVASGAGIINGLQVSGTGIQGGVIVLAGGGTTTLTLSQAITVTSGQTLTFQYSQKEMSRIRSQMLHGPIPSSSPAGQLITGIPLAAPIQDNGGQVFNVKAFGAKGDGVTDDEPATMQAVYAAINAGGGTVFFPRGTYLMNAITTASVHIFANASHMHFVCSPGATLVGGATNPNATMFNIGYPPSNITAGTSYPLQPTTVAGVSQFNFTNIPDAANFAQGDPIFIIGGPGHESRADGEINWVTSVDTINGILYLYKPTSKIYSGNVSNPAEGPPNIVSVYNGRGQFFVDESIEGCTVNTSGDFSFIGQVIGAKILKNTVTITHNATRGMMMNSYYPIANVEIAGNKYTEGGDGVSGSVILQFATGFRDFFVHDNDLIAPYGGGIFNPSQGVVSLKISNNTMYMTVPPNYVNGAAAFTSPITFSTAYNVTIDHNHIYTGNSFGTQGFYAILLGLSNGSCVNCIVDSNTISGSYVSSVIATGAAVNTVISNNLITGNNAHVMINISNSPTLISNNIIREYAGSTQSLYMLSTTVPNVTITGNQIYSDYAASLPAINTSASGNTFSYNTFSGMGRAILYQSGATALVTGNNCLTTMADPFNCGMNLNGVVSPPTTAIAAGSCTTTITQAATGVTLSDSIVTSPEGPAYTNGLVFLAWPSANNVNFQVCNPTAASLTPVGATFNWKVLR